ncbi:MerR family transcriptional regulator [Deinococcus roseus]|uniref:MerR family transcriptional regulator n=1 Tax=Deinococcus roseus TaxID=392414 RepID=A0ABQ2CWK2_9DEIO|nr:MerR family transcriptional regulator [Deinococcus roseus]GGJ27972.1 MerR family transcriptional regulator [Deinococcus roseus]
MARSKKYKIGELAQLSGVPVKTVRYYSDLGVLPPSEVSETGHRWYTDLDHARLEAIRSLREVGVGLETIAQVMQHEDSIAEALRLQLRTLELEMNQLQRRKVILQGALKRNDHLGYLRGARTLAALNARERQDFLNQQLEQMLQGVPADPAWIQNVWKGPLLQLPEHFSDQQFESWLELAELMLDENFIARFQKVGQEFWGSFTNAASRERYMQVSQQADGLIRETLQQGVVPDSAAGQQVIQQVLVLQAGTEAPEVLQQLAQGQLQQIERHTDARALRFWELVEELHGRPAKGPSRSQQVMALHEWRVQALLTFLDGVARKSLTVGQGDV